MINIAKLFRQPCQVSSKVKVIEKLTISTKSVMKDQIRKIRPQLEI